MLFCDLRGFTAFATSSQPEEVLGVLSEFFHTLGQVLRPYEATVGSFTGDGLMAFFNDPLPCQDPALRAINMATDLNAAMNERITAWQRNGYGLGLGIGIALGWADIGMIGFDGRHDYTAVGPVVNLAARLCAEAQAGQILIDQRAHAATAVEIAVADRLTLTLKGFHQDVVALSVSTTS